MNRYYNPVKTIQGKGCASNVTETLNELLGIEGMCSNIYFRSFGHMFRCEFEFHGRNRIKEMHSHEISSLFFGI